MFKLLNKIQFPPEKNRMNNGQFDGIQQGWREDGDLKFNFTYIDGKRYGFLGTTLCVPTD